MENKAKHLEMLQNVVNRMASNSFLLKSWSVVLVSALLALSAKDRRPLFAGVAYLPAVAFWLLDGFYLLQERLYREVYDRVRARKEEEIDFSMNTSGYTNRVSVWLRACVSPTLLIFHGAVFLAITAMVVAC